MKWQDRWVYLDGHQHLRGEEGKTICGKGLPDRPFGPPKRGGGACRQCVARREKERQARKKTTGPSIEAGRCLGAKSAPQKQNDRLPLIKGGWVQRGEVSHIRRSKRVTLCGDKLPGPSTVYQLLPRSMRPCEGCINKVKALHGIGAENGASVLPATGKSAVGFAEAKPDMLEKPAGEQIPELSRHPKRRPTFLDKLFKNLK